MTSFQIIDDKQDCFGVYIDGNFIHDRLPVDSGTTWGWSPHIRNIPVYYCYLLTGGKTLAEGCPGDLKERFSLRQKKIKAFINSFISAKIKIEDACLFDLIPTQHLKHYLEIKNQICDAVLQNYIIPKNYSFLHNTYEMINEIAQQTLTVNWELLESLALVDLKAKSLLSRFSGHKPSINYDLFGTVTGRLSIHEGSFPILNIKTENRGILTPCNDAFLELDYNGEQVRTLLSLSGKDQPTQDIHDWNMRKFFHNVKTREGGKKKFFAWLYNPDASDKLLEEYYDKRKILDQYYNNGVVSTPFGREIKSDNFHALNYLIQSTASDNCLTQVNKIHRFLRNRKSKIAFIVHDSVVIDLAQSETFLIPQIKEIFEDTPLGKFKVGMKLGKNYGKLREFSW